MQNKNNLTPWESLIQSINQNKIPHAILIYGPSLSSLSKHAYDLASHILLKNPTDPSATQYKLDQKICPDIYEFSPQGKARLHSIELAREIRKNIGIPPYESSHKIYILHEADRMVLPAISVFLKVLEDAPFHSVIILTSQKPQTIPATVLSRTLTIHIRGEALPSPNQNDIVYLTTYYSGGEAKLKEIRNKVKEESSDKQQQRERAKYLLTLLLELYRDRYFLSQPEIEKKYPHSAQDLLKLPKLPIEKVLFIISFAYDSLENSSSACSCLEWAATQLMSLKNKVDLNSRP